MSVFIVTDFRETGYDYSSAARRAGIGGCILIAATPRMPFTCATYYGPRQLHCQHPRAAVRAVTWPFGGHQAFQRGSSRPRIGITRSLAVAIVLSR